MLMLADRVDALEAKLTPRNLLVAGGLGGIATALFVRRRMKRYSGIRSVKIAPSTVMRPPCASATRRASVRPSPKPRAPGVRALSPR